MRQKGSKNREFKGLQITYPASGFQNDTVRLLQTFVATKSIRFEQFVTLWKASNFTLIYLGRTGIREKRELLEEAFVILLKYIMPPYNLQVRVGALYALYCLYHTQRLNPKTRIRIPLSCWPNFCHLQNEVLEQRHLDAGYVIRQLVADRAFMLCAYPSKLSVDEVYIHGDKDRTVGSSGAVGDSVGLGEGTGLLAQIQDEDSIGQLHAVHEKYHELKCQLNANHGGLPHQPSDSINLIKPDIAETILSIISRSEHMETDKCSAVQDVEESAERAKKLKAIKAAASASKAGQASRPHRTQMKDSDEQGISGSVETPGKSSFFVKKKGRPSPKCPKVRITSEPTSSSSDEETLFDDDSMLKRQKKKRRKRTISGSDEDHMPSDLLNLNARPKASRRHSSRSSKSYEEEEKNDYITRKRRRSSADGKKTKQVSSSDVSPGMFIAICPDERNPDQPIIGKVITVNKSLDKIELALYKGAVDSSWTPITAISSEDNVEGKPLVETVCSTQIIMTGLTFTKGKKLTERIKHNLRKAMENALAEK